MDKLIRKQKARGAFLRSFNIKTQWIHGGLVLSSVFFNATSFIMLYKAIALKFLFWFPNSSSFWTGFQNIMEYKSSKLWLCQKNMESSGSGLKNTCGNEKLQLQLWNDYRMDHQCADHKYESSKHTQQFNHHYLTVKVIIKMPHLLK